jgi:murein L,D-transpeptidase YafK
MTRPFALLLLLAAGIAAAESQLPAYVLQLPDGVADLFVADASNATLYRYSRSDDGVRLAETTYMSIGQKGVGKEREWDRRTPLGIYFVSERLDTSRMHEKYGVMAFPLDYPNIQDRVEGRSGDGIWVHGVPPGGKRRPEFDTDGCIALPNEDLLRMQSAFVPGVTPVVIARHVRWAGDEDRERIASELRTQLARWAQASTAEDPAEYIALYAPAFDYRGLTRDEWASFRMSSWPSRGGIEISLGDVLLLADPEEPGMYLSRFRQRTTTAVQAFDTVKRLYWRRGMDGMLRIISEDNG